MKIEIELTKTQVNTLRQRMGLKTKTKADVVVNSLVNLIVEDEYALKQW